jgi:hypothetical protein
MNPDRELLLKILVSEQLDIVLSREVGELLAQPDKASFKPDWANYRQGVEDSKREPLSDDEVIVPEWMTSQYERQAFVIGVRFAEKAHGIGVK